MEFHKVYSIVLLKKIISNDFKRNVGEKDHFATNATGKNGFNFEKKFLCKITVNTDSKRNYICFYSSIEKKNINHNYYYSFLLLKTKIFLKSERNPSENFF